MKRLSDALAGEHGDIDVIMTEQNRLKLARMRAFLMDEEERYEEIDPYDIANLPLDKIAELQGVSFGDEGAKSLPDDILTSIGELRSGEACNKSAAPVNTNRSPTLVWRASALACCVFVALSAFLLSNNWLGETSSTGLTAALPLDKEEFATGVEKIRGESVQTSPHLEPIKFASIELEPAGVIPNFYPSKSNDVLIASATSEAKNLASISEGSRLVFTHQLATPTLQSGSWASTVGESRVRSLLSALSKNYDSQDASQVLKEQFGNDVVVDKTRSPSGVSIVVRDGKTEVHFFRIVVTNETPNPASAADSVSLSPNVFAVVKAAMKEGNSVDPTRMRVNDEIVGMVAKGEGRYVAPEITFARGNSSLRYSECQAVEDGVQLASMASRCIVEQAAVQAAVQAASYGLSISSN